MNLASLNKLFILLLVNLFTSLCYFFMLNTADKFTLCWLVYYYVYLYYYYIYIIICWLVYYLTHVTQIWLFQYLWEVLQQSGEHRWHGPQENLPANAREGAGPLHHLQTGPKRHSGGYRTTTFSLTGTLLIVFFFFFMDFIFKKTTAMLCQR